MLPSLLSVNPVLLPPFLGIGPSPRQQGPSFMGASLAMYSDGFTCLSLSLSLIKWGTSGPCFYLVPVLQCSAQYLAQSKYCKVFVDWLIVTFPPFLLKSVCPPSSLISRVNISGNSWVWNGMWVCVCTYVCVCVCLCMCYGINKGTIFCFLFFFQVLVNIKSF